MKENSYCGIKRTLRAVALHEVFLFVVILRGNVDVFQSFSPVKELRADQVLTLGSLLTEMGSRELQDTNLTHPGVLAHLGTLTGWTPQKVDSDSENLFSATTLYQHLLTNYSLSWSGSLYITY